MRHDGRCPIPSMPQEIFPHTEGDSNFIIALEPPVEFQEADAIRDWYFFDATTGFVSSYRP